MIIAELSHNHMGSKDLLHLMVKTAAEAGANFVKIQTFFADDLSEEWKDSYQRVKQAELNWDTHKLFTQWCRDYGTEPMTTVYSTKYMNELHQCGFKWIKIGSPQATNGDLMKLYIATGFKVIMSTGGHNLMDLPRFSGLAGVLHCKSVYPHPGEEANLMRMFEIKRLWPNTSFGFSSHIDPSEHGNLTPLKLALYLGATYVEVHYTILPKHLTKDGQVSLCYEQLKELCEFDRMPQQERLKTYPLFGTMSCDPDPAEKSLIDKYKSRWKDGS